LAIKSETVEYVLKLGELVGLSLFLGVFCHQLGNFLQFLCLWQGCGLLFRRGSVRSHVAIDFKARIVRLAEFSAISRGFEVVDDTHLETIPPVPDLMLLPSIKDQSVVEPVEHLKVALVVFTKRMQDLDLVCYCECSLNFQMVLKLQVVVQGLAVPLV
jgi:hypothetical protein